MKIILLVDDLLENLHTIAEYFSESKLPYQIMKARDGYTALKLIERKVPDLIITDWEMPEMDGIEFIKRLRAKEQSANIPVIMCTGVMISSEHLQIALKAGANDYIRKPIDQVELIARTNSILKIAELQNEMIEQKKLVEERNLELNAENEEIANQRDLLKIQHNSIIDSIAYAKRIQRAVLPPRDYINEILPENFILFKPKDVVSGDFYWIR